MPPKVTWEAWGQTTTSDIFGVQGQCYHYSHFDLNGLCFHPDPGFHPGPKLLPRAMSGSMVLLQQGSMLMSVARVTSGAKEPRVIKSEGLARLALLLAGPGMVGPAPCLTLLLESWPPTLRRDGPISIPDDRHRLRETGSAPCLSPSGLD